MSVDISIHYDHSSDVAYGGVLSMNLKDLASCFELKGFRRHHPQAACTCEFAQGLVRLKVVGVPQDELAALMEAFRKSMAKIGFRLLFSYANPSHRGAA